MTVFFYLISNVLDRTRATGAGGGVGEEGLSSYVDIRHTILPEMNRVTHVHRAANDTAMYSQTSHCIVSATLVLCTLYDTPYSD